MLVWETRLFKSEKSGEIDSVNFKSHEEETTTITNSSTGKDIA